MLWTKVKVKEEGDGGAGLGLDLNRPLPQAGRQAGELHPGNSSTTVYAGLHPNLDNNFDKTILTPLIPTLSALKSSRNDLRQAACPSWSTINPDGGLK